MQISMKQNVEFKNKPTQMLLIQWRKDLDFKKWCWKNWISYAKEKKESMHNKN